MDGWITVFFFTHVDKVSIYCLPNGHRHMIASSAYLQSTLVISGSTEGGALVIPPLSVQLLSIFMQFLSKNLPNNRFAHPPLPLGKRGTATASGHKLSNCFQTHGMVGTMITCGVVSFQLSMSENNLFYSVCVICKIVSVSMTTCTFCS